MTIATSSAVVAIALLLSLSSTIRGGSGFAIPPSSSSSMSFGRRLRREDDDPSRPPSSAGGGGRRSRDTSLEKMPPSPPSSSSSRRRRRGGEEGEAEEERRRRLRRPPVGDFPREYRRDDDYEGETRRRSREREGQRATTSSPSSIDCPHFGTCPGCVRDGDVGEIDVVRSARSYFSSPSVRRHAIRRRIDHDDDHDHDIDIDGFFRVVVPSPVTGWRTQAKLAIAPRSLWSRSDAGCVVGLYMRNSHDVMPIPECKVHHPSVNRAISALVRASANVRTPAYREDAGVGLLRHAQVRVDTITGKVCLTLVMNAERYKETQPQLSHLTKELRRLEPDLFHSIWCHCNDSRGNSIFLKDVTRWHPVDGMPYLRERIPGSDDDDDGEGGYLYFSPHVFRQANMEGFAEIAREVREAIPPGSKVCELYAGVGLLGLSALLHHGRGGREGEGLGWLRCSDENPENAKCFERSVDSMSPRITGRESRTGRFRGGGEGGGRGRGGGGGGGARARAQRRGKAGRSNDNGELSSIKDLMDSVLSDGRDGRPTPPPPETEPSERVTYMQANAASALYRGQALGADVLVVDPPRKGLDEVVLQQLSRKYNPNQMYAEGPTLISHLPRHTVNWTNDVRTLIYVSCGFDALARDLDALLSSNAGWKLESATGYVLFPGSNHVETVVVLRR